MIGLPGGGDPPKPYDPILSANRATLDEEWRLAHGTEPPPWRTASEAGEMSIQQHIRDLGGDAPKPGTSGEVEPDGRATAFQYLTNIRESTDDPVMLARVNVAERDLKAAMYDDLDTRARRAEALNEAYQRDLAGRDETIRRLEGERDAVIDAVRVWEAARPDLVAERDRARECAVALEQELAHLRESMASTLSAVASIPRMFRHLRMDTAADQARHAHILDLADRAIVAGRTLCRIAGDGQDADGTGRALDGSVSDERASRVSPHPPDGAVEGAEARTEACE